MDATAAASMESGHAGSSATAGAAGSPPAPAAEAAAALPVAPAPGPALKGRVVLIAPDDSAAEAAAAAVPPSAAKRANSNSAKEATAPKQKAGALATAAAGASGGDTGGGANHQLVTPTAAANVSPAGAAAAGAGPEPALAPATAAAAAAAAAGSISRTAAPQPQPQASPPSQPQPQQQAKQPQQQAQTPARAASTAVAARPHHRAGAPLPPTSAAHVPGRLPFEYQPSALHLAVEAGDLEALKRLLQQIAAAAAAPAAGADAAPAAAATTAAAAPLAPQPQPRQPAPPAPPAALPDLDLEALNAAGETALVLAVNSGALEAIELLTSAGASRHYRIHWAAQNGHAKSVAELLRFGAPADLRDEFGVTPLVKAALAGHTAAAAELLAAGADVNTLVQGDRTTAILLASANGHAATVSRLLEAGARVMDRDAEQRSPLIAAGGSGSAAVIKVLVAAGDVIDGVDSRGDTALHLAARAGHLAAVQELLASGAVRDRRNAAGETALVAAAQGRHAEVEAALVAAGANVHFRLHWAAQRGDAQVVKDMLLGQAPVNLQDGLGFTALNVACRHGQQQVAAVLLEAHADMQLPAASGHTPLMSAAEAGHAALVKLLLNTSTSSSSGVSGGMGVIATAAGVVAGEGGGGGGGSVGAHHPKQEQQQGAGARAPVGGPRGCDLRMVTLRGRTALHLAAEHCHDEAIAELLEACKHLPRDGPEPPTWVEQRSAVRARHQMGLGEGGGGGGGGGAGLTMTGATMTATMTSAYVAKLSAALAAGRNGGGGGGTDLLPMLPLSCPGIVNAQDFDGYTAVLLAAERGHTPSLGLLLALGADINRFNAEYDTPLHAAAKNGHAEVVRALIAAGAPLEVGNTDKNTALHCAAGAGHLRIVQYLIAAEAVLEAVNCNGETPLALAASKGHVEVMRFLISRGANVNAKESAGRGVLLVATRNNQLGALQVLLEAGCAVVNAQSFTGYTAFHGAARCMDVDAIALLLAAGADPRLASTNGEVPLHNAIVRGHLGVVRALLAAGVPPDTRDNNKIPGLHMAIKHGHVDVARELLDAGADPNSRDWEGDTPLTLAGRWGQVEIAELLLQRGADALAKTQGGLAPVHRAAERGQLDALRLLMGVVQDKLLPTASGRTLVHVAAAFGQVEVVQYLLTEGGMDSNQTCVHQRRRALATTFKSYDHHRVLVEGLTISTLADDLNSWDSNNSAPRVTSVNTPLPSDRQLIYVEITILECEETPCIMGIGLGADMGRTDIMPGTFQDTHAYLAATGARYSHTRSNQEQYGPKYGKGDVIGLVYNRSFHTISFTRNGTHLGVACRDVPVDGQSLMIGFGQKGIAVEVNFGAEPYKFNLDDLLVEEESMHNPGNKEPWRFKEKAYPLHLAACSSSLPVLELLLASGAVVGQVDADTWTALHFAALLGWHEGVRLLLQRGADPNAVTAHGSTALQFAVKRSHSEASKVLLDSGADYKVVDKDKRTLLMWAASTGNVEIMQLLIDKGVGIKEKDALGRTAMQYACNEMVVNYLEAALNQILIYRDVFEINLQAEVKRGAEGTVVMAKHVGSGNAVAIKFHKHKETRDYSAGILRQLNRKFVAGIAHIKDETVFDDGSRYPDAPYAMVCEAGDKDLQEILDEQGSKPLPENQCRYIFECMVAAVRHLHSLDLVHHDLKAKNFVRFFDGRYCLVDFDNCRAVDKLDMGNTTIEICPPEVAAALLKGERLRSHTSMDIWSLGCCLYQMITQDYLLSDLRSDWKGDIFRRDSAEALMAWSNLTQEHVDAVLQRITACRNNVRMAQHAQGLLQHMLQVDPRQRYTIDDVVIHSFLKGGSTATMDAEALEGIRSTLGEINTKVDSVLKHVIRIDERTLALADLPMQLQAGLAEISQKAQGIRDLVAQVAAATECPHMFVVAPELSPRQQAALCMPGSDAAGRAALSGWLDDLKQVFAGDLTLTAVVKRLTSRRFRLRLVCEHCLRPVGDGYLIERPEAFTAKLLPALQCRSTWRAPTTWRRRWAALCSPCSRSSQTTCWNTRAASLTRCAA